MSFTRRILIVGSLVALAAALGLLPRGAEPATPERHFSAPHSGAMSLTHAVAL